MIWLLGALSGLGPFALDVYLPGLPAMSRDLHVSAAGGQLTLTACMIGIAVGQLVGGPVSDAHGRRRPLLAGMLLFTISSAGCAAASSLSLLVGLRLIEGISGGVAAVLARAIIRDHHEGARAAREYAAMMAINGLSPVIAPAFGGLLLKLIDWRGEFIALTVTGVLLTLACAVTTHESLPAGERHGGGLRATLRTFGTLLCDSSFAPYMLAFSIAFGAMFAYISASAFVLEGVFGLSPQLYGVIFAAGEAGFAAAAWAGGRLLDRFTALQLLYAGLTGVALTSAGVLGAAVTGAGLWLLLPMVLIGISCQGVTISNGVSVAMAGRGRGIGSASALLGFTQFTVGAVVAPLVGVGGGHDAVPMGVVMCVCGVAALVVVLAARGPRAVASSA